MSSAYYCLSDDMTTGNRWFLKGPLDRRGARLDPRLFTYREPVECDAPLYIPLRRPGRQLDFTLADFDMPVLRSSLARELQALAPESIQLFPAVVEGSNDSFHIVNVVSVVACLDEQRSTLTYWTQAHGRPDKVGKPMMVVELRVDTERAAGKKIFRLKDWKIALIVSEDARDILRGASGAVFRPV